MAYDVQYYFDLRGEDSMSLVSAALNYLRREGLNVAAEEPHRGAGWGRDWTAAELLLQGGDHAGVLLEVHGGDDVSAEAWRRIAGVTGAPDPPAYPGLSIMTLSGDDAAGVFPVLRAFWMVERHAAEYDETDGFTTT